MGSYLQRRDGIDEPKNTDDFCPLLLSPVSILLVGLVCLV